MATPPVTPTDGQRIAHAIATVFVSPNEMDRNMEHANVVDGLFAIARALEDIAAAIQAGTDRRWGKQREEPPR